MRHIILQTEAGEVIALTTESPASSYGIPVLSCVAEDLDGDFGPADILGKSDILAADVVRGWASRPRRTDDERDAARRFLEQWPEGPQL